MPRAIWTGAVSFGLVNVPVKAFPAVQSKDVRFHQLDGRDGVRIQQRRVNPTDGSEVPYERIVKGFEISPDEYVLITPAELEGIDPASTRSVDVRAFVRLDEIDPLYFGKPYYLAPTTGGTRAYALLRDVMAERGRVAIGTVVLRNKEHLVALRASGRAIVMFTLAWHDEVVSADQIEGLPGAEVVADEREMAMATQLVDALAAEWDPSEYRDTRRAKIEALIEAKAAGQEIVVQPLREPTNLVTDLMDALRASIEKTAASEQPSEVVEGLDRP